MPHTGCVANSTDLRARSLLGERPSLVVGAGPLLAPTLLAHEVGDVDGDVVELVVRVDDRAGGVRVEGDAERSKGLGGLRRPVLAERLLDRVLRDALRDEALGRVDQEDRGLDVPELLDESRLLARVLGVVDRDSPRARPAEQRSTSGSEDPC